MIQVGAEDIWYSTRSLRAVTNELERYYSKNYSEEVRRDLCIMELFDEEVRVEIEK